MNRSWSRSLIHRSLMTPLWLMALVVALAGCGCGDKKGERPACREALVDATGPWGSYATLVGMGIIDERDYRRAQLIELEGVARAVVRGLNSLDDSRHKGRDLNFDYVDEKLARARTLHKELEPMADVTPEIWQAALDALETARGKCSR